MWRFESSLRHQAKCPAHAGHFACSVPSGALTRHPMAGECFRDYPYSEYMQTTKDDAKFHIVLVQAIAFKDGKALIAQRSHQELQAPGMWSLPGGKVELYGSADDVIENTLHAEFREEVGIELEPMIEYLRSGSFVRNDGSSVVTLCFLADWKAGEAKPLEDSIAVDWIAQDQLDKYEYPPGVRGLLEAGFARRAS